MHTEAESTRRVCILELFGARAGFVAANAAVASGHVDLVMIPEVFRGMKRDKAEQALQEYTVIGDNYFSRPTTIISPVFFKKINGLISSPLSWR